jgi:Tol biopolymer transport system component
VGAVVVVVAAASVTGWFLLKSDGNSPTKSAAAKGPAPLPSSPLLVRVDRQPGWPDKCYGSVGEMTPGATTVKVLLNDPTKCDLLPQWSPDHQRIAFTRSVGALNEVWVMNADGSGAKMLGSQLAGRNRLAWSPDGTKIASMAKNGSGQREIYILTVAKPQSPVPLTTDSSNKDDPAWCRDRMVFWSDKSGTQQIYTTDATKAGAPWTQVTKAAHTVNDPSWSPDCSKIAYTDQPDNVARHIWVVNADGSNNHQLTTTGRDVDPTWSPNGTWIAFSRGLTADPRTWAIRLDGSGERAISPTGKAIGHPNWR